MLSSAPVAARTDSTLSPSAISIICRPLPSGSTRKTPFSVMTFSTQRMPVSGSVQFVRIFGLPLRSVCSIVTMTREPDATRSIAPPIPLTSLPGIM